MALSEQSQNAFTEAVKHGSSTVVALINAILSKYTPTLQTTTILRGRNLTSDESRASTSHAALPRIFSHFSDKRLCYSSLISLSIYRIPPYTTVSPTNRFVLLVHHHEIRRDPLHHSAI